MIINKIFSNVETFKDIFSSRIVGTYGRSVEESHRFEKYIVLGTMIRDYASVAWKNTKESVQKELYHYCGIGCEHVSDCTGGNANSVFRIRRVR